MLVDGPSTKYVLHLVVVIVYIVVDMHVRGSIFCTIIVYLMSECMWAVCFEDLFVEDEPIKLACALLFFIFVW